MVRTFIAGLALLMFPFPAMAQFKGLASAERLNRRIAGHVDDYTQNQCGDRRIDSAILGMPRDLYVYLPPGYSPDHAYPLLVYFHLAYVDEHIFVGTDWIAQLDQMICRGEFPPTIVACPDGTINGRDRTRAPHSLYVNGVCGRFQDHIVQEVLPFVSRRYSVRPEREAHALLGLSAGSFGAMGLAIKRRDVFGAVATLAGPLNLRYFNLDGDYFEDFDPATYVWRERYDPNEVVGRFYFGLKRTRVKKYIRPVFGTPPGVEGRIRQENPADLLFSTDLKPGELAIYVNYPGRDNWNFDAQAESFIWLAGQKGVAVTFQCVAGARHNLSYFRANHEPAYRWLAQHLLPPVALVPCRR